MGIETEKQQGRRKNRYMCQTEFAHITTFCFTGVTTGKLNFCQPTKGFFHSHSIIFRSMRVTKNDPGKTFMEKKNSQMLWCFSGKTLRGGRFFSISKQTNIRFVTNGRVKSDESACKESFWKSDAELLWISRCAHNWRWKRGFFRDEKVWFGNSVFQFQYGKTTIFETE